MFSFFPFFGGPCVWGMCVQVFRCVLCFGGLGGGGVAWQLKLSTQSELKALTHQPNCKTSTLKKNWTMSFKDQRKPKKKIQFEKEERLCQKIVRSVPDVWSSNICVVTAKLFLIRLFCSPLLCLLMASSLLFMILFPSRQVPISPRPPRPLFLKFLSSSKIGFFRNLRSEIQASGSVTSPVLSPCSRI